MKLTKQEIKEINRSAERQLNKYIALVVEYSKKHTPAETVAFEAGVNKGLSIVTE